jgi:hypothetical protein
MGKEASQNVQVYLAGEEVGQLFYSVAYTLCFDC